MKMRKAIVAFLAAVCMVLSVCTLGASAEGTNQVTAETGASIQQGSGGHCAVYLDDLTDLASLTVAVHYDPEKVTVTDSYNQVACTLSDSSNTNGCLQYSYIFDGSGSNEKTKLFYFYYQINGDAAVGDAYFDIVVSNAYTAELDSINVSGSRCKFTITEAPILKDCHIYGADSVATSVKEEFEVSYRISTSEIASGSFSVQYDSELFEVVEVTKGGLLTDKLSDVNTTLDGSVAVSFVGTAYNYQNDLVTVKFRTLKNETESSQITLTVTELYDLELNGYVCNGYTTTVNVAFDESYTEDAPSMFLSSSYDAETDKVTLTVKLEAGSHLGAGDFVLNFDADKLTYVSSEKGFAPTFFNINDSHAQDGVLKFSIISMTDITDAQTVLTVTFDAKRACTDQTAGFEIMGSGLSDALTNSVVLNFVDTDVVIPLDHADSATDNDHVCDYGCGAILEACTPNEDDGDCTTDITCSVCGTVTTAGEASHIGGTATCTAKAKCTRCSQEYGEMLDHVYTDEDATDAYLKSEATCTSKAVYYKNCATCDKASATDTFEYGSTEPHSYTRQVVTDAYKKSDASCTKKAVYYYCCATCDAKSETATYEYGEKLAHTYEKQVISDTYKVSDADCDSKAVYNYCCTTCDAKGTTTFEYGEILGHTGGTSTCTAKAKCTRCNQEYGGMLDHTYTDEDATDAYLKSEATCTSKAVYYKNCATCDKASATDTFEYGSTEPHSYTRQVVTDAYKKSDASCTEKAVYYYCCATCDAKSETATYEYGEKLAHTYEKQVISDTYKVSDADCDSKAVYNYCCMTCDAKGTTTFEYGEILGHTGGTSTCTAKAKCTRCSQEYGEMLDHVYTDEDATDAYLKSAATCTSKAVYYKNCATCDKASELETFESGEKIAHSYVEKVDDAYLKSTATCTAKAVYYKSCSACGVKGTETFEVGEDPKHNYSNIKNDETSHWNECACGEKTSIEAHIWNDGEITKDATADEEGVKTYTCSVCGQTKDESIAKLPPQPNTPNNINTPEEPDENDGLSSGAIAGIVVGSVAIVGIGGFAFLWFVIKKKRFSDLLNIFKKK